MRFYQRKGKGSTDARSNNPVNKSLDSLLLQAKMEQKHDPSADRKEYRLSGTAGELRLPAIKEKGSTSIEETLNNRRSVRDYRRGSLNLEQISQLLWAASGRNRYRRTIPSAGATYPLEIYLVAGESERIETGVYHYSLSRHAIEPVVKQDVRKRLSRAALGQTMIEEAPISIVIAAAYDRTTGHYGQRGIRYVHMEVGHAAQNVSLQAIALHLGTVMIGAFEDSAVREILGISEDPLYIIPVGKL